MPGLTRHYLSTLAGNAGVLLLGTVSGVLAARLLGPEGRGELAVITLWPMTLALLGSLGMNRAITFFGASQPERRPALLSSLLTVAATQSLLLLVVGFFLLPRLLRAQAPMVQELGRIFLLYIPLVLFFGYLLNVLQGGMRLGAYNASRVFVAAWYALLLTLLYVLGRASLAAIVVGQLAGYAAVLVLNVFLVGRAFGWQLEWNASFFRPLLSYGAKTQLGAVTSYLNLRLDQLVMSLWLAPEALGYYVVAVTLATPLTILPGAIGMVTLPAAAREPAAAAHAVIRRSLRTVVVLLTVAAALLFLLVPFLLPLFFGEAFSPAATACRVLVAAMVPLGLANVLSESLRGLNRPLAPAYAELVGNGVTVVLLYWLLPRYQFLGAAYASLGAYTASFLFLLWYVRSRVGLSPAELLRARGAESPAAPGRDLPA